jgi:aspartyl-tRNA(Asn)/glutamyl-tRNA(Gln) amidotransferase subunit A
MIAYASSLDQGGPMARSAEDTAILLQAMAGFDPKDSTGVDCPVPNYLESLNKSLDGLTIGLPKEFFGDGLDSGVATVVEATVKEYQKLGATVKDISIPNLNLAIPAYYVIASAECSANLSRFDGVRFGYRCKDPVDLTDLYVRSRGEAFGKEVKRRILMGTYALSAGYYDAYYLKAQKVRRLITEDFKRALQEVDVIMGPVAPSVAFAIGEKINNPIEMYLSDIYTIAINLAGLPAMSIPAGFVQDKPVGLHIIGNYFAEDRLLNIAHQYQKITDWHQKSPKGFE